MASNSDLPKLLRAIASGTDAIVAKHDIILLAAANEIERLRDAYAVLDEIRGALEERGFFHMANGRDIGFLLDEKT